MKFTGSHFEEGVRLVPILDKTELAKEKRKQRRLEALGSNNPKCGICGMANWQCLELHHVADRNRDDVMVPVCRNCHRLLSDAQKDWPLPARLG